MTSPKGWRSGIRVRTWPFTLMGYAAILLFVGGFSAWALTAPLTSATIAPGTVVAAGQNVAVQHLEGGIVKTVVRSEGERVRKGEPLLVLDSTVAEAQLDRLLHQMVAKTVEVARLEADRDEARSMAEPPELSSFPERFHAAEIFDEGRKEFEARARRYEAETQILSQRITALNDSLRGLEVQKKAGEDQLEIVREEADRKKALLDRGLTDRDEYTVLLRTVAGLVGQVGALEAEMAGTVTQLGEARVQIERLKTGRVEEAVTKLNETRQVLADMAQQIKAARSSLERTVITAPTDGVIIRSVYNAPGSVIRPGEVVMELLPTSTKLVVEARVHPQDIDTVRQGQDAELVFVAFNANTTPRVMGKVYYVSADQLQTQNAAVPEAYYLIRLTIDPDLAAGIDPSRIYPGMPVQAFIQTGARTFSNYLVRPLLDSMSRAFKES